MRFGTKGSECYLLSSRILFFPFFNRRRTHVNDYKTQKQNDNDTAYESNKHDSSWLETKYETSQLKICCVCFYAHITYKNLKTHGLSLTSDQSSRLQLLT